MSKLLILAMIVIGFPSLASAEPERMKDDMVVPPCTTRLDFTVGDLKLSPNR